MIIKYIKETINCGINSLTFYNKSHNVVYLLVKEQLFGTVRTGKKILFSTEASTPKPFIDIRGLFYKFEFTEIIHIHFPAKPATFSVFNSAVFWLHYLLRSFSLPYLSHLAY